MDLLANTFSEQARFLFVYCREAHPKEYPENPYPAHESITEKTQLAREMRDRHGTPRTILVDTLDGEVHQRYGGCPNMSFIIDHTGRITYKSGWTVAQDIKEALEQLLLLPNLKRRANSKTFFVAPYYKEPFSYHLMEP